MNFRIFLILVMVQTADCLMCYFCADTSNVDGRNQCQTWHRTMRYYRKRYEKTGSYRVEKYVKNCSDYGDARKPKYCMVAWVAEGERVNSFIRDCSDGTAFFSDDVDILFQAGTVRPDNQTSCQPSLKGFTACLTLCGQGELGSGDFCNGPVLTSSAEFLYSSLFFIMTLLLKLFCSFL
ncbi:uncharacterized protein LOC123527117 [Mercenaria mercenaria]|uniref:uncharacterized protein LOC123527117 n=1 Tax=Mercenaria mercenaria TaxID=6596 RepID=UPI001E1D3764|nr:uncharacterized protein LOC123527117 [Mercenaria mercenaria]